MSKEQQRRMAEKRRRTTTLVIRVAIATIAVTVFAAWVLLFMR